MDESIPAGLPLSRSQEVAQKVLASVTPGPTLAVSQKAFASNAKQTTATSSMSALGGAGGGGPTNPIYVTIAERMSISVSHRPLLNTPSMNSSG